jgi:hypothetical protein
MGSEVARSRERSKSRKLIESLYESAQQVYVIHYSCESFYENPTGGLLGIAFERNMDRDSNPFSSIRRPLQAFKNGAHVLFQRRPAVYGGP